MVKHQIENFWKPPSEAPSAVVVDPMDDPEYIPEDATLYSTANDGNLEVMKRIVYKIQDSEYGLTTTAITNKKNNVSNAGGFSNSVFIASVAPRKR